jgi:hypothetical protein
MRASQAKALGSQRIFDGVELCREHRLTKRVDGDNNCQRNSGGNQAVFYRGSAIYIGQQARENSSHDELH